jgi:hypothetical protein
MSDRSDRATLVIIMRVHSDAEIWLAHGEVPSRAGQPRFASVLDDSEMDRVRIIAF